MCGVEYAITNMGRVLLNKGLLLMSLNIEGVLLSSVRLMVNVVRG